ncbi:MAG: conjugative transposon protein TraM [Flavobacteriaceae bacterium]|nr:conjugative transposon protein TraM [Flavobacteriaceae bacterium]
MKSKYNQPKYVLPLIILPFFFIFNYFARNFNPPKKTNNLETTTDLNTNIPKPSDGSLVIKNKMDSQKDKFKELIDVSAIDNEVKEKDINTNVQESLYTEEERQQILKYQDSLRNLKAALKKGMMNPFDLNSGTNNNEKYIQEQRNLIRQKKKLRERMLDSILNPEKYINLNEIKKTAQKEIQEKSSDIFKVTSLIDKNKEYFNTLGGTKNNRSQIEALIDENITVSQGSRVRMRTNTDITVNDIVIPKFSYIYGIVTGFQPERVHISINSILVNNQIYKVNLDVYDLDGMKGLYVRNSKFVEFSKELGSKSAETIGSGLDNQNNMSSRRNVVGDVIREITRVTAQATSKFISKNKAHLKYNTNILLINKNLQK